MMTFKFAEIWTQWLQILPIWYVFFLSQKWDGIFWNQSKLKYCKKKVMTLFSNKKLQKASKLSIFKKEMYSLLWPLLSLRLVKLWTLLKVKKSTFWNGTILIGKFPIIIRLLISSGFRCGTDFILRFYRKSLFECVLFFHEKIVKCLK